MKFIIMLLLCACLSACKTFPVKGDCVIIAEETYAKAIQQGYQARLVSGLDDKGIGHRWVEYYNDNRKQWCVWDDAIWSVKGRSYYTAAEHGYTTKYISKICVKGKP